MNIKAIAMLVKFFSRGSGGGDSPVNYLLGDDRDREGASILRGNAEITKELINSTDYARRYTSGALSFEESYKTISAETKALIMDNFEKTLFSGLQPDQYNILWVQHTDKNDRLELNFLIPNMELRSGKRLQPFFHAADLKRVNAFQNVINMNFKFSDPHDPSKKRLHNPHFSRSANLNNVDEKDYTAEQKRLVTHKSVKNELTAHIYDLASSARFKNRAEIRKELERSGYEIKRVTNRAISVKSPKFAKNIRLDDAIFSVDFRAQDYIAVVMQQKQRSYERDKHHKIFNDALEVLEKGIEIKAEYHVERFASADVPKPYELGLDAPAQAQTLTDEHVRQASKDISSPSMDY
jgi:hypothetical protein